MSLSQFMCGLRSAGHHYMTHFEEGRVYPKCIDCLHEGPGWEVAKPLPKPPVRILPFMSREEARMVREQLVQIELGLHGGG